MSTFRYVTRLDHEYHMRQSIAEARKALRDGELPFAAVLVDATGTMVLSSQDTVCRDADPTAHAEAALARRACRQIGPDLAGYTVYTTVEPCPMCFTALWLAGITRIVYGVSMIELREKCGPALHELWMPAELVNEFAPRKLHLIPDVLSGECLKLFDTVTQRVTHAA
jgi:tRNA(adenine34) deaminase